MPRYKLTVAYDGTDFHGWQKQHPPNEEPLRTVQGVLEQAVREVVREDISVTGASRTDAGVHAIGQVASFASSTGIPTKRLRMAVNSRLPDDVQVRRIEIVDDSFEPISACTSKGYQYRLAFGRKKSALKPLFDRHITTWTAYELDCDRMHAAAQHLIGEHDFASFTRLHHGRESTVRTIHDCSVTQVARRRCTIEVSGNGFLYNMVRIIAGTLHNVGRGAIEPEAISAILAARDRTAAGPTLPPEGLFLMWVEYGETNS
jgi:tRNA pseudouridine38-40 synthase